MRVTSSMIRQSMLSRVTDAQSRLLKAEEQLTTGRRVVRPEDDPAATALARRLDAAIAELHSYEPASREVRSNLETADDVLSSAFDRLVRVKELALTGANGALNDGNRAIMAEEVEQIRQDLINMANTQINNQYLFGGNRDDRAPFLADGTYQGNPNEPELDIAPGARVDAVPDGADAFTAAGGLDVMDVVANVRDALRAGDLTALGNELGNLDSAQDQVNVERSNLGSIVRRVESADEQREALILQLTSKRSEAIDADIAETVSRMALVSQSLEAALTVTARALSHTLLDKIG